MSLIENFKLLSTILDRIVRIVKNVDVHKVSGVNIQYSGCFRFRKFSFHSLYRDALVKRFKDVEEIKNTCNIL